MNTLKIYNTADLHTHFRDPHFFANKLEGGDDPENRYRAEKDFEKIIAETIRQFGEAIIMPNAPAIDLPEQITWYRDLINSANKTGLAFNPLMVLKIGPKTTPEMIYQAQKAGAISGKLYPDGVTTGSQGGVQDFEALYPVFKAMQKCGMVLSIHGEAPKNESEKTDSLGIKPFGTDETNDTIFNREIRFHSVYRNIRENFKKLHIVLEHITDRRTVDLVVEDYKKGYPTAATITVHHLIYDIDSVLAWPGGHGEGLNPHHYCKPIAKYPLDRKQLLWAVLYSGLPCFFLGSDTAPHYIHTKECDCGCAGVYSAPVILPLLAHVFETHDKLSILQKFVSDYGRSFYKLPKEGNGRVITLAKEAWTVPEEIGGIVPLMAGKTLSWKVMQA